MDKKSFSVKFSKLMYIGCPIVLAITLPFIVLTIINMAKMSQSASAEGYRIYIDIIVIVLLLLILTLGLAILFLSRYVVSKKGVYVYVGFFHMFIKSSNILNITYFRTVNKIALYFKGKNGQTKQVVLNIDEKHFDNFVSAVKEINKNISYTIYSDDEE